MIDVGYKVRVLRVENVLFWDVKGINKVLDFFFVIDCCINFCFYYVSNMDCCDINFVIGGVDENGLLKDLVFLSD